MAMTYQAASEWGGEPAETGVRRIAGEPTGWRRMLHWFQKEDAPREVGPYRLSEKVGEGGMGVVYKATHPSLSRPLALKLMQPARADRKAVERFEHEARVTRLFDHPNMISVFDSGRARDGSPYLVMEYLDGRDLHSVVKSEGPLAPARVAAILAQIAGALAEVHRRGLVHGDLKPANVMLCTVDTGESTKLLDFGLAHAFGRGEAPAPGEMHEIAGTPLYLSPEVLTGKGPVDGRSDLYALGVLGYFLLTGVPPFTGKTALDVCLQHLDATPVPPSHRSTVAIPQELDALILRCLAKTPEQRPASAQEVRERALAIASHSMLAN
jgi:eukaryotic-like serine/threonine-protein kinase